MGRFTTIRGLDLPEWEIALALRWLTGELSLSGVAKARGNFNASNSLAWVAPRLRAAFAAGGVGVNKDTPVPEALKRRKILDELVEADVEQGLYDKVPPLDKPWED